MRRGAQAGGAGVAALLASGRELQLHACASASTMSEPQPQPQPLFTLEAPLAQRFHQMALVSPEPPLRSTFQFELQYDDSCCLCGAYSNVVSVLADVQRCTRCSRCRAHTRRPSRSGRLARGSSRLSLAYVHALPAVLRSSGSLAPPQRTASQQHVAAALYSNAYMCTSGLQESTTAASEEVDASDSPPPSPPAERAASRAESAADQCAAAAKRSTSAPQRRKRAPADTRALRFVELLATQSAIPFPRTCAARFANGTLCRYILVSTGRTTYCMLAACVHTAACVTFIESAHEKRGWSWQPAGYLLVVRAARPVEQRLGAPRALAFNTVLAPDTASRSGGGAHNTPGSALLDLLSGGGGGGPMLRLLDAYCAQSECNADASSSGVPRAKRRPCASFASSSSLVLYDPSALEGFQRELAREYQWVAVHLLWREATISSNLQIPGWVLRIRIVTQTLTLTRVHCLRRVPTIELSEEAAARLLVAWRAIQSTSAPTVAVAERDARRSSSGGGGVRLNAAQKQALDSRRWALLRALRYSSDQY